MTRSLCVAAGIVVARLLLPSTSAAQNPPPPNIAAPQTAPTPQAAEPSAPVTLTGCLERSKPPNPAPTTAYVLRSEPSTTATDARAVVYSLVANGPSVKLDQHVGHRVTITGTLKVDTNQQPGLSNQGVSPSTPSGSTGMETMPKPDPMAPAHAVSSLAQPIFVDSVKMLEGGCKGSTE